MGENNIRAAYDRWSRTYDSQPNATRDLDAIVLQQIMPDPAGKVVVEAGCGTGESTVHLAHAYTDHLVLGVDKSAHRLDKACRREVPGGRKSMSP